MFERQTVQIKMKNVIVNRDVVIDNMYGGSKVQVFVCTQVQTQIRLGWPTLAQGSLAQAHFMQQTYWLFFI